jgi:hypothetical protein
MSRERAGHTLQTTAILNEAYLRQRWEWDPLRNDPRFQRILTSPEPKTVYK